MSTEIGKALLEPIGDVGITAGHAGSTSAENKAAAIAAKYLNDSSLLMHLTDRVYQLWQEDLDLQRERVNNYRHPRWL